MRLICSQKFFIFNRFVTSIKSLIYVYFSIKSSLLFSIIMNLVMTLLLFLIVLIMMISYPAHCQDSYTRRPPRDYGEVRPSFVMRKVITDTNITTITTITTGKPLTTGQPVTGNQSNNKTKYRTKMWTKHEIRNRYKSNANSIQSVFCIYYFLCLILCLIY